MKLSVKDDFDDVIKDMLEYSISMADNSQEMISSLKSDNERLSAERSAALKVCPYPRVKAHRKDEKIICLENCMLCTGLFKFNFCVLFLWLCHTHTNSNINLLSFWLV